MQAFDHRAASQYVVNPERTLNPYLSEEATSEQRRLNQHTDMEWLPQASVLGTVKMTLTKSHVA